MNTHRYRVVDVFTTNALEGNPLAVFPDARGLDDGTMQRIARELNLAETAFVFPATDPGCVVRVRIFTPETEMSFAGHPTIGTSAVLVDEGIVDRNISEFVLEEKIGPVRIRRDQSSAGPMFWLTTPQISFGKTFDRESCARALSLVETDLIPDISPQLVSAGNPNIYVPVRDKSIVDRASTGPAEMRTLRGDTAEMLCLYVFTPTPNGAYSRMFAPELGVFEDPATGSAAGPLAAYMMRYGLAPQTDGTRLLNEQGTKIGRRSLLHILIHGDRGCKGIEAGGQVVPIAEARMTI